MIDQIGVGGIEWETASPLYGGSDRQGRGKRSGSCLTSERGTLEGGGDGGMAMQHVECVRCVACARL